MIDLIGKRIAILHCSDQRMTGLRGIFALETMKTITVVSDGRARRFPKLGTVFQVQETTGIVVANEMLGRLEDRIAKGGKV